MSTEARSKFPNETGGVLVGYWSADGRQVVIVDIVGPGPGAKHSKTSFCPDGSFHIEEVERIYNTSGRVVTYLGDWHTHPTGGNTPSDRDQRTLKMIACDPEARAPCPVMAILDGEQDWELGIWVLMPAKTWFRSRRVLVQAKVIRW